MNNFAVLTIAYLHFTNAITISATTNNPCHLTCYYTDKAPGRHRTARTDRGLTLPWAAYYCFVAWKSVEQNEPGDTLTHTFEIPDWSYCHTKWFAFRGTVAEVLSPSVSCLFEHHHSGMPPPQVILLPNGPGDETDIPILVGAPTHWQAILTDDGDTSYVETPNDDPDYHRDLYTLRVPDVSPLDRIATLTIKIIGRILQPNYIYTSICVRWSLKTHGTLWDEQGVMPAAFYGFVYGGTQGVWTTNPHTGSPWTWDEIKTLQVGVNLHRSHKFVPGGYFAARVTQLYALVAR